MVWKVVRPIMTKHRWCNPSGINSNQTWLEAGAAYLNVQTEDQRTHKPRLASPLHMQNSTNSKRIAAPRAVPRFPTSDLFPPQPASSGPLVNSSQREAGLQTAFPTLSGCIPEATDIGRSFPLLATVPPIRSSYGPSALVASL